MDGLQSPNDKTASTGWNSLLTESNPVDDIGFLKSLAQFMQEKYGLTREETFAAGFSNGAFMMYRLALEGQDHFCAVASICGRMPEKLWPLRGEKASVGLLQISGTKDDVIPMRLNSTDKYTRSPAIEDVVAWFAESQGLSTEKETELAPGVVLFKYLEAGGTQKVWHVIVKDGHHGWFEKKYSGFDANDIILDFFDSYYA